MGVICKSNSVGNFQYHILILIHCNTDRFWEVAMFYIR